MSDTHSMGSKVVVLDVKPGFVVKTKTMGKGGGEERRRKVLVNACGAREVPKHHHPLVVSPDDFAMKFMMEGENDDDDDHNKCSLSSNSWAFACGEKRKDVDGAGKECDVYDVAFNDEVVEVAKKAMFEPLGVLANDIGGGRTRRPTREAKVRDSLAKMCVEIVSRKYYSERGEDALDPKFTLPKREYAGTKPPPLMRAKISLPASLKPSQLQQQQQQQPIVELNNNNNNNNNTTATSSLEEEEEEEEEEEGFAFRLSSERKRSAANKKRKQQQLKNVASTITLKKKPRVKIETTYPDKPLTTFAAVKLTFDSRESLDRAKLKVQSRESTLSVTFDDDDQNKDDEDDEDLRREGAGNTNIKTKSTRQTEFPFFIDVEKIREIETEEFLGGEKSRENGDSAGETVWRDPLTLTIKIPFILTSTL